MVIGYCVVPHYVEAEPTRIDGWCVVERSSAADTSLGCYPTREEAEAVCHRMTASLHNHVA
ncbi:hypothetical protein [Carnimonas bestiolae]|uniref:hypothetical protein n=1 Tax=Carnimonas bestiolae TaxID=3402172 RepID=UPI003EDC0F61